MKTLIKYLFVLVPLFLFSGCEKFLNVRPNNNSNLDLRTVADFEQVLNRVSLASPNYLIADLTTDEVAIADNLLAVVSSQSFYSRAYLWEQRIWQREDYMYNATYRNLLHMNTVVDYIGAATDGSPGRKAIVAAQARINRAYYYLQLVNIYGPHYDAATAATDLGVALVLHPDATALPTRNTVQEVYDQVLADLDSATKTDTLPDFGVDVIHPGKAAAYALLARTHLYMGNYDMALAAADTALSMNDELLDYRNFSFVNNDKTENGIVSGKPFTLLDEQTNPETIYAKICIDIQFFQEFKNTFNLPRDLATLYGTKDLRYEYGFIPGFGPRPPKYRVYFEGEKERIQFNYGLGVPEMMLIKAECLARLGNDDAGAMALVNKLRQYRFKDADYKPLTAVGDQVLATVLEERRRELYMHGGVRLFDLKRLNKDPRFRKDLTRTSSSSGEVIATLPAGSPRYLLPFSPQVTDVNKSITQNPR